MAPWAARKIRDAADALGINCEVRGDYVGRGCRHETHGVILDDHADMARCCALVGGRIQSSSGKPDLDDFIKELMRANHDSMGLGVIYY